ncbi:MAG: dihydrofolate reductase [Cyclobacteriaceae bacterium]|nr:dihydrofolate reductase [Cyclobacteriaceae bacterium]
MIKIIMAAIAKNNVIGKDNNLIWHLPADLRFFKQTTKGHTLIMGRKTFESLGNPLPHRDTLVVTRYATYTSEGITVIHSLESALAYAEKNRLEKVFILGGGEIYRQSMDIADKLIITEVHAEFEGDTYFPEIDTEMWKEIHREEHKADEKNKYNFAFVEYVRRN